MHGSICSVPGLGIVLSIYVRFFRQSLRYTSDGKLSLKPPLLSPTAHTLLPELGMLGLTDFYDIQNDVI